MGFNLGAASMNRMGSILLIAICTLWVARDVSAQGNDRRWQQRTSVHAVAVPTEDFLKDLCQKHKIEVEFDPSVERDAATAIPFSLEAEAVSVGSVVDLVCRAAGLTYILDKGTLKIRSLGEDDLNPYPVLYPLNQLGPIPDPVLFLDDLKLLTDGDWDNGKKQLTIGPRGLEATASRREHLSLEKALDVLSATVATRPRAPTAEEKANQLLFRKLQSPKAFTGDATTVKDALDQLLTQNDVPLWIDAEALGDEMLDLGQLTVTMDPKKLPTSARLDAMLTPHKLTWQIRNEVVQVTTLAKASEVMYVAAYPIRQLISPTRSAQSIVEEITTHPDIDFEYGHAMEFKSVLIVYQNASGHSKVATLLR